MAIPNPEYKPNWQEVQDFHDAERKRIDVERDAIQEKENELFQAGVSYQSDEMKALARESQALQEEWDTHHRECLRCLDRYQHKTVQDAAKWLFDRFDPSMGTIGAKTIHQIDFEQFQTIDEAHAAWVQANDVSQQMEADQRNALEIGQPNGSDIFTETGDNQISSSWQVFDASTMGYNPGLTNNWHSHSLVTVDQRNGEYHICFMHDPDTHRGGGSPMNFIEDLATTMYRRALTLHEPDKKSSQPSNDSGFSMKGLLSSVMKRASAIIGDDTPRPEQFHFYIHVRPQHTMRETFCRVDMEVGRNGFYDPDFKHFDVIPEIIQQAYYETAMPTVTPKDVLRLDSVK